MPVSLPLGGAPLSSFLPFHLDANPIGISPWDVTPWYRTTVQYGVWKTKWPLLFFKPLSYYMSFCALGSLYFSYGCDIFSYGSHGVAPRTIPSVLSSFLSFGLISHSIGEPFTTNSSTEVIIFNPQAYLSLDSPVSYSHTTHFPSHTAWDLERITSWFLFLHPPYQVNC